MANFITRYSGQALVRTDATSGYIRWRGYARTLREASAVMRDSIRQDYPDWEILLIAVHSRHEAWVDDDSMPHQHRLVMGAYLRSDLVEAGIMDISEVPA